MALVLAFGLWFVRWYRRRDRWSALGLITVVVTRAYFYAAKSWLPGVALREALIVFASKHWPFTAQPSGTDIKEVFDEMIALAGLIVSLIGLRKPESKVTLAERVRCDMLNLVRTQWITKFLERTLNEEIQLEPGFINVPDALLQSDSPRVATADSKQFPPGTPIANVFKAYARLLILGDGGGQNHAVAQTHP